MSIRHEAFIKLVEDSPIKQGVGVYEGLQERAILVFSMDAEVLDYVTDLAFAVFEQEAVLRVDANRYATLNTSDRGSIRTGRWHEVTEDEARGQDHTLVEGRYFVAR